MPGWPRRSTGCSPCTASSTTTWTTPATGPRTTPPPDRPSGRRGQRGRTGPGRSTLPGNPAGEEGGEVGRQEGLRADGDGAGIGWPGQAHRARRPAAPRRRRRHRGRPQGPRRRPHGRRRHRAARRPDRPARRVARRAAGDRRRYGPRRHGAHALSLGDLVELARALDRLPARLVIIGIEGGKPGTGNALPAAVQAAVESLANGLVQELAGQPAEPTSTTTAADRTRSAGASRAPVRGTLVPRWRSGMRAGWRWRGWRG